MHDLVLDVRRVCEDGGTHDGGGVVRQEGARVPARVARAVAPALNVASAPREEPQRPRAVARDAAEALDEQQRYLVVFVAKGIVVECMFSITTRRVGCISPPHTTGRGGNVDPECSGIPMFK